MGMEEKLTLKNLKLKWNIYNYIKNLYKTI